MTEADQRLTLMFVIAVSLHVLALLGIVAPITPKPAPGKPLTVTLSTTIDTHRSTAEIIAAADQAGVDDVSRRDRTASPTAGESDAAASYSRTPGTGADVTDTPLLSRLSADAPERTGTGRRRSDGSAGDAASAAPTLRRSAVADPRAAYLEKWRHTVERAGSRSFPYAALSGANGEQRLTVEVTLTADGGLVAARVQHSSGNPELDLAALQILRGTAPFAPFPGELRKHWQQLTFAYDWRFLPGHGGTVNVQAR